MKGIRMEILLENEELELYIDEAAAAGEGAPSQLGTYAPSQLGTYAPIA
jgi:hypothetical protein